MKTVLFTCIATIAILFAGCKGDTGAQGPAGTANITSSAVISQPGDWSEYNSNPNIWVATYTDPDITDANSDLVEAYVSNGTDWYALPSSNFLTAGDQLAYSYDAGTITFYYDYSSPPSVNLPFKISVIPPDVAKKYVGANWKDYNTVNAIMQAEHPTLLK